MLSTMLAKAQIISKEANVFMTVCFNPKELCWDKSASWDAVSPIEDEPNAVFGTAQPASLSVNLLFDTYEMKTSVYRLYTSQLEKLIHIVSDEVRRPPMCIFNWGSLCFAGVVETLSCKYTMFIANGVPVRCECALKMKKVRGALSRTDSAPTAQEDRSRQYTRLWGRR